MREFPPDCWGSNHSVSEGKVVNVHCVTAAGSIAGTAPVIVAAALVAVTAAVATIAVTPFGLSAVPAAVHVVPAPQHLHVGHSHVQGKPGCSVSSVILPRTKPALNVNLLATGEVLVAGISEPTKSRTVEPFGFFSPLSGCGGVAVIAGNAEGRHRVAGRGVPHFRIPTEVADDDDLVHRNLRLCGTVGFGGLLGCRRGR